LRRGNGDAIAGFMRGWRHLGFHVDFVAKRIFGDTIRIMGSGL
jgi:hypothetical protein